MSPVLILSVWPLAALDPTPDQAHVWLREELSRPEYQDHDILNRIIDWFLRQFDNGVNAASASPILTTLAAIAIFVLLVTGFAFLAARTRRTSSAREVGSVGIDSRISATEYRRRAEQAFAAGDFATAVVEGFRALATRQVESGRIEDLPQATAREVGGLLIASYPKSAARLADAARLFDEVLYGDHAATREQATGVLAIDQSLRSQR